MIVKKEGFNLNIEIKDEDYQHLLKLYQNGNYKEFKLFIKSIDISTKNDQIKKNILYLERQLSFDWSGYGVSIIILATIIYLIFKYSF